MNTIGKLDTRRSLLAVAITLISGAVCAQSTGQIEEVVVTAQFREQNLQSTPISITAMNAEMLSARGHANVIDVASAAPGVTLQPPSAGTGKSMAASIRGIGQYDFNLALEPGVGIYIDDVYHPTLFGSVFDLLDLERVEVLRGPQGTLAGKNSIGGAIKLHSRKPTGDGDGFIEATAGSNSRRDFRAAYDFSLIPDQLFMRVSAVSKFRDGHVDRVDYGCHTGLVPAQVIDHGCRIGSEGGEDYHGMRAALRWLPTENLEVNFAVDLSEDDSEAGASILATTFDPANASTPYISPDPYTSYATYTNLDKGYSVPATSTASGEGYALDISYQISDQLTLRSITSYREYEAAWSMDVDGGPISTTLQRYMLEYESTTQEFRLSGIALNDSLDYTLGTYWFRGRGIQYARADLGPVGDFLTADPADTDHLAVFLHTSWRPVDALELSFGLRYTDEEKEVAYVRLDPANPSQPAAPPFGPLDGTSAVTPEDRVDYRASVSYNWTDNFMTFASVSTGYKGGGINPRAFTPAQVVPFGPEELIAYEIGFKSDWFDRRARLNVSAFFNDYEDIQLTITTGYADFPLSTIPLNVGEAEIKGVELELQLEPIDGLLIDIAASTLDFKYTSLTDEAQASGVKYGMIREFTPEKQGTLGIQYRIPLGSFGSITPRLDVVYQGSFHTGADNSAFNYNDSYTYSNAKLTYTAPSEKWEVALSATNLTDKEYFVNTFANPSSGTVSKTPARPREYALSVRYNF
ncbi:MAG: TonB-dependent receptor [Spongiibacteraceae bacterium]|jgi:iron complex outermembrane receptor protein|nr:TonB-dependent receptor [Spongiibacteraceae bacterium]